MAVDRAAIRRINVYRKATPIIIAANDRAINKRLSPAIQAFGVSFNNMSAQWLHIGTGSSYAAPTSRGTFALNGDEMALAEWAAPPGVIQPVASANQIAVLVYTEEPLPDAGGPILGTVVASQITLERFLKTNIPTPGNPGRVIDLIDYDRSLWVDDGTVFASLTHEEIDVKAYHAKGDAVTDDTIAIQAALTVAAISGGTVVFPPGTYVVTSSLVVSSNTKVRGSGGATLISMSGAWTGSLGLFTLAIGAQRVIIEDLQIDGTRTGKVAGSTARGIYVQNANHVWIRRVYIQDCSHAGILFDGGTDLRATDCYIFRGGDGAGNGALANGITADINGAACSNIIIANNMIDQVTDDGIAVQDNVTNATVVGNVIECNSGGAGQGINVAGAQRVSVIGNTIRNVRGIRNGILVEQNLAAYKPSEVAITGNAIEGGAANTGQGIQVTGTVATPADRISINGNVIRSCLFAGIAISTEMQFSSIQDNIITGCADGIYISQGAGTIQYNRIDGNIIDSNTGWGINLIEAAIALNRIQNNFIRNNTSGGINATTAQRSSNRFAQNGPQDTSATYLEAAGLSVDSITTGRLRQAEYQILNNGVAQLLPGIANFAGLAFLIDRDSADEGIIALNGGNNTTTVIAAGATFSGVAGTAAKTNVYWSAGNARYEIENKRAATRNYVVFFMVGD